MHFWFFDGKDPILGGRTLTDWTIDILTDTPFVLLYSFLCIQVVHASLMAQESTFFVPWKEHFVLIHVSHLGHMGSCTRLQAGTKKMKKRIFFCQPN